MNVLVIGATGRIGHELVKQSLAEGHQVTALVRSPEKLGIMAMDEENLTVIEGNPLNPAELGEALPGHQVVFSALGADGFGPTTLYSDFGRALVKATEDLSVRAVLVSAAVLFKDAGFFAGLLGKTLLKNTRVSLTEMEQILDDSCLDWSVVRPPKLTEAHATNHYQAEVGRLPKGKMSMSRADVAAAMLKEAKRSGAGRRVVGLAG